MINQLTSFMAENALPEVPEDDRVWEEEVEENDAPAPPLRPFTRTHKVCKSVLRSLSKIRTALEGRGRHTQQLSDSEQLRFCLHAPLFPWAGFDLLAGLQALVRLSRASAASCASKTWRCP